MGIKADFVALQFEVARRKIDVSPYVATPRQAKSLGNCRRSTKASEPGLADRGDATGRVRDNVFAEVKRAYALAGKPAQMATKFHDAGHKVDNETAFQWLNQRLNPPSKPRNPYLDFSPLEKAASDKP